MGSAAHIRHELFSNEIGARLLRDVGKIMQATLIPGTATECPVDKAKLHPFHVGPQIQALFDLVDHIAVENGFPAFGRIRHGDTSEAVRSLRPLSLFSRAKIYTAAITGLPQLGSVK